MEGNYIIEEACKVLPPYFYNFLKINLKTKSKFLHQKTVNTNIKYTHAVNFTQFCKQKDVKVIRIYMAELVKLVK